MLHHVFDNENLTLWFFIIGIVSMTEIHVRLRKFNDAYDAAWKVANTLTPLLAALLVFATYYYPHMKSAWGGGSPINVLVYFNKDSAIKPNQSVAVQLIDESHAGFYIVGKNETKAIFVPRNSVSLIYFSDNPGDTSLLK